MLPFSLDDSLGYLINRVAARMRLAMEYALAPLELTPPQWMVLVRLHEQDGLAISAVGAAAGFDKATMSGLVVRLEDKGLLARRRSAGDGRVVHLHLTEAGRRAVAAAIPRAQDINARAAGALSADERLELARLLRKLEGRLDDASS